jgi:hypothetical protein
MIEVTEKDIGRKVVYTSRGGETKEEGVITSFNDSYIFVRYGNKCNSQATHRRDLEFI